MPEENKIPIKEKVKALMETADEAYPMIFTEEHFTNFLSRMTTLHMSPNNAALLYSQDNNVSYVAGFNQWQNDYSRSVRRGQQSLKILAPSKYTFTKENPQIQPDTGEPVMDSNGNPVIDKESVTVPTFKPVSVFNITQTYGREVIIQDTFHEEGTDRYFYMQALDNASSYHVDTLSDYPDAEKEPAFTDQNRKQIRVRTDIPTGKIYVAVIKQMAWVKYHENDANAEKDALTSKLEIAGIAYAVNRHYGLPAEFTFDIEPWTAVQELDTLKQSLKDIKQTANDLIADIDNSLTELYQNLNKDFTLEAMDVLIPNEKVDEAGSKVYLGKLIAMAGTIESHKPEDRAKMNTVKGYLSNLQNRMPDGELKTAVREASWSSTPVVLQNRLEQIYQNHLEYKGLLPDMTITQTNARDYGYTYADMLPLQEERALELFNKGHDIFLLYDKDTESSVSNREEIESFSGIFGIEREEWDASIELKQLKDDLQNSDSTKEMLLLYGKDNRFGIYQVKRDLTREYAFESLERLQVRGLSVDRNHYDLVYLDDLNPSATLDDIYEQFNINHPGDYTGRSLSVSDIVVIRKDGETKAHYVDDFGFQEIPDFLEMEHSIRNELQEQAFKGNDYYLSIQESEDGYDYSIFDQNYNLKDGGLLNNPHIPIMEAVKEVAALHGLDDTNLATIDYDELMETTEQAASAMLESRGFKPLLQEHLNTNEEAGYLTPEEKRILEERLSFMDAHMMAFEESYPDGLPLDVETDEIDRLFQEVLTNTKAQEPVVQGLDNYSTEEIERLDTEHAEEILINTDYQDISFYVAESMEFKNLGEYIDGLTLPQAIEIYKEVFGKGNGLISGIGMQLHDGSMYDGLDIALFEGGHVLNETINGIDHLRQNPSVQKALADIFKEYPVDERGNPIKKQQIESNTPENQEAKQLLVSMEGRDGTLYYTSFVNESTDEPVIIYDVYMRDTRNADNPKSIGQYMSDFGLKEVHNIGDILTNENVDFLSLPATGQPQFKEALSTSDKTQILLDLAKHWKTRLGEQEKQLILDYASHASDFDRVILLGEELSDAAFEHTFGVMNPVISEEVQFEINCLRENSEIHQMVLNIDDFMNHTDPDGYKDAFDNKRQTTLSLYQMIVDNMPDIMKYDLDKALLNLSTNGMPHDVYVKYGNELLTRLDKLETEKTPHQLAKDILEYTISITPEAVPKTVEQHEKEIYKLASAFMRQQPDMLIQAEMLLRSAVDNQSDGTKAADLLQRLTDMNDKILKKHMEPQVTIFRSGHPAFQEGQQLSLSSANKLMEVLNKNDIAKQAKADEGSIPNCNIYYEIAYLMDSDLYHYTGNQDITKGHGSMTDHIRAYAEQDLQEKNFSSQAADADSKNEEIETLIFCRDELAPYLEMHCNYADIKKSAQTALSEVCQSPDGTPFKDEKADYYAALVRHAEECHEILSLKDMDTPLPQMPQQEEFVTSNSPQSVNHDTKFSDKSTRKQSEGRIASGQKQSILAQLESSKQELSNTRPRPDTGKDYKKTKGAEL